MIIRELVAKLGFDIDTNKLRKFDQSIKESRSKMQGLTDEVGRFGASIRNVGIGLSVGLTLPIVLMGRSIIKSASSAEESAQKFNVVFRDLQKEAGAVADSFAKNFGVARDESRQLIGTTGDLLTGFGFTQEKALTLSERVAKLGADLASFNDIQGGASEAITRLTKGMLGEVENLKLMSISIDQGEKSFRDRVEAIRATTGATKAQAKAEVILQMALEQSHNAIGDLARTSGSYANQVRFLKAELRNLAVSFGTLLIPVANRFVGVLLKVIKRIDGLSPGAKKVILAVAGIVAVLGPALLVLGLLITSIAGVITSLGILKGFLAVLGIGFGAFSLIILKVVAIVALIGGAIYLLINDFLTWKNAGDSVIGSLIGSFENFKNRVMGVVDAVKNIFSSLFKAIRTNSQEDWNAFINDVIQGFVKILEFGISAFNRLGKVWEKFLFFIKDVIYNLLGSISDGIGFIVSRIGGLAKALGLKKFVDNMTKSSFGDFMVGMPGAPPIKTPSQLDTGTRSGGSQNTANVTQNVTLQVPPGTPVEQQKFIEQTTKKIFDENMKRVLNETVLSSPRGEK